MIGVEYDLFWTLNPKSLSPFIKAFDLKQKHEDSIAWQHGAYVRMAIVSAMSKNEKYPDSPILSKSKPVEMTPEEIKARVMAQAQLINSKFGKEK